MLNLFPIPVAVYKIDRELTREELAFIDELNQRPNIGNKSSVNNYILNEPEMASLGDWIKNRLFEYFDEVYKPKQNVDLKITQSWVNFSQPNQFHHKHAHGNSLVSGVFYFKTNPTDKINFHGDKWQQLEIEAREFNIYNSETWWLEAMEGNLILFPSYLQHSVPVVDGEKTRVSMAFNTFPTGLMGNEMNLTAVRLGV